MKNKNKKLTIVVASLLVVIGISFAYFAASNFFGGSGSSVSATTATLQGSELKVEGTLEFNDLDIYPGHESVSSIKVTATGDNELIPYNVIWEGTNTLNTPLNYTIYKTSSEIDVSASCEKQKGVIDGAMMYYEECKISNIDSLGTQVSSGTINTNETKVTLITDEFITSTSTGEEIYYYVILEYPNLEEAQNSDIGGTFTGKVTVELSDAEPDIKIIAAYVKQEDGTYKETSDIPQSGYILNTEKSVCSDGASVRWDTTNNDLITSNLTKSGTSCYLYFDEQILVRDILLANYSTQLTRNDFSVTVTDTTTGTIYYADTSKGKTYYFAGNPTDNWVRFAGFYWRIIRINEDGTIRMIYQGTSTNITGTGTQIGTSVFNSSYNDNMYVGYMYTSGQVHGLENSGTIKVLLDNWYQDNLESYVSSIDGNAGFCGDREPSTSSLTNNGSGGTGTTYTYYGAYIRLITNKAPTFECENDRDLYTTIESGGGNGALDYPIGLISVDEVAYAGGVHNKLNQSFYLYTNQYYWTMSPYTYGSDGHSTRTRVFYVYPNSYQGDYVGGIYGVRPVINLKADVQLTGTGTATDPYVVVGAE